MKKFLHLYFLVYKYDCPQFMDGVIQALDVCCRGYWDTEGDVAIKRGHMRTLLSSHIDLAITSNGGEYPRELAPTLAEMWARARKYKADCSGIVALLENDPELFMAVTMAYQDKYLSGEEEIGELRKRLKMASWTGRSHFRNGRRSASPGALSYTKFLAHFKGKG